MDLRIETLDEKTLVGICLPRATSDEGTAGLWRRLMPRLGEINARVGSNLISMRVYRRSDGEPLTPSTPFDEWAAAEVSDVEDIPEGMKPFTLPSGGYAVFIHRGPAATFPEKARYIFGNWLPNSAYDLDDRPHFAVMGPNYRPDDPAAEEEIWIPVSRARSGYGDARQRIPADSSRGQDFGMIDDETGPPRAAEPLRRVPRSANTSVSLIPIDRDGTLRGYAGALPDVMGEVIRAMVDLYGIVGFEEPWIGYLSLANGVPVGACGFKSPPSDGRVEIAYFTFPDSEGRGFATAMASELSALAGAFPVVVAAQTLPERNASHRVLEKVGFRHVDTIDHPDDGIVWEWRQDSGTKHTS